jgi:CRP/FNR family transcriptional regulator, cyclic AMP receptor protein
MWKKKDPYAPDGGKAPRSSFFSSGFYGTDDSESPNSSQFMPSAPGVLAPSERVATVPQQKADDKLLRLVAAIQGSEQFDAIRLTLKLQDWIIFAQHLQMFTVETGQEVIRQGATEVTVYLIESGTLGIHREDDTGKVQLATVGAGSVVGEGAFFARNPRNATVQALSRCTLWGLSPMRYAELAHKHPSIALSFVMALGSVVTRRMTNKPKRAAVT